MRWAVGAAVLVIVAASAIGAALVFAPSGEGGSSILVSLVDGPKIDCLTTRVVRVDRASLKPKGHPAVSLKGAFEQPVYSPRRDAAALGGNSGTVALIDVSSMRLTATARIGSSGDDAHVVAWPAADRLVAISYTARTPGEYSTKVGVVDPARGEVVSKERFRSADVWGGGATRTGRVPMLVISRTGIAAPRLLVVEADRRIRAVTLARLRAGIGADGQGRRLPGFAVDPKRERAFVVGEGQPVAIIDLRTLHVRYRKVDGLGVPRLPTPPRNSPAHEPDRQRMATWLGDGLIVVSGSDSFPLGFGDPSGLGNTSEELESSVAFGLKILDTRSWRMRMIDRRPSSFEWLRGRIVAYGRAMDSGHHPDDKTVIAFDRTGRRVYEIRGNPDTYWQAFDGRLFLLDGHSRRYDVRDARTGHRLSRAPGVWSLSMGPC